MPIPFRFVNTSIRLWRDKQNVLHVTGAKHTGLAYCRADLMDMTYAGTLETPMCLFCIAAGH